jgi:hypothetical protein
MADPDFHPVIAHPAYRDGGPPLPLPPRVAIDQAHANFHTAGGRYRPFADLLRLDGYRVDSNTAAFTPDGLRGVDVLVIANARGGEDPTTFDQPAFTPEEVRIVHDWVEAGGSLLLIADHAPFGAAAERLAQAFGVGMGKGFTQDRAPGHSAGNPTFLRFSRENGLLGDHAITRGREPSELVTTVQTFTGQSLVPPPGATVLLALASTAQDRPSRARAEPTAPEMLTSAAGRAQGLALIAGGGRVVVLGEAALLSAQVIHIPGISVTRMGMNVPGSDDQQFALNILHWLSRLLD